MSSQNKRRETDLMKLMMSDYKVEMINDGLHEFYVYFHGPSDSPYHGGVWKIRVKLPDNYPYKSPSIAFINKIYHPNVNEKSSKCIQVFIPQLLLYPNPSSPLNRNAAALMMRDQAAYEQQVKEYCEKYAKAEDVGEAPEESSSDEEPSDTESYSSDEAMAGSVDP